MNYRQALRQFQTTFDNKGPDIPDFPSQEVLDLRMKLITEEVQELQDAVNERDMVETADALADILYVVFGMADRLGLDIDAVFKEVHRSNMAKANPDGSVNRREDGKVLKPAGWTSPDIRTVLHAQGWDMVGRQVMITKTLATYDPSDFLPTYTAISGSVGVVTGVVETHQGRRLVVDVASRAEVTPDALVVLDA